MTPAVRVVRVRIISTLTLDVEVCGSRLVRALADPFETTTALELPSGLDRLRLGDGGRYVMSGPLTVDEHADVMEALTGDAFTNEVAERAAEMRRQALEKLNGA